MRTKKTKLKRIKFGFVRARLGGGNTQRNNTCKRENKAQKCKIQERKAQINRVQRIMLLNVKARLKSMKLKNIKARLVTIRTKLRNERPQRFFLKADKVKYLQLHLPGPCNSQVGNGKKAKYQ